MILEMEIEKVVVNGKTTYDFDIFSQGARPVIGMYDEISSFVSFVTDAAEDGSSNEMAYVLVGEKSIQRLLHISDTNNPYRFDLLRRIEFIGDETIKVLIAAEMEYLFDEGGNREHTGDCAPIVSHVFGVIGAHPLLPRLFKIIK